MCASSQMSVSFRKRRYCSTTDVDPTERLNGAWVCTVRAARTMRAERTARTAN